MAASELADEQGRLARDAAVAACDWYDSLTDCERAAHVDHAALYAGKTRVRDESAVATKLGLCYARAVADSRPECEAARGEPDPESQPLGASAAAEAVENTKAAVDWWANCCDMTDMMKVCVRVFDLSGMQVCLDWFQARDTRTAAEWLQERLLPHQRRQLWRLLCYVAHDHLPMPRTVNLSQDSATVTLLAVHLCLDDAHRWQHSER